MNHRKQQLLRSIVVLPALSLCLTFGLAGSSYAITCEKLKERLAKNEGRLTLIDIRRGYEYESGHLPGAIHVPFQILGRKPLPPLGDVVVYGDGLDAGQAAQAVEILNGRDGIHAVALEGGYGRWVACGNMATDRKGLVRESEPLLLYERFANAVASDSGQIVLVDLRSDILGADIELDIDRTQPVDVIEFTAPMAASASSAPPESNGEDAPKLTYWITSDGRGTEESLRRQLGGSKAERKQVSNVEFENRRRAAESDPRLVTIDTRATGAQAVKPRLSLRGKYPQARLLTADFGFLAEGALKESLYANFVARMDHKTHKDVYVLIDRGDGRAAMKLLTRMRRLGIRRVWILAGGEETILNGGKPIKGRQGGPARRPLGGQR